MVNLDLDIITKKPDTITLFGKKIAFKNIPVEEDFRNDSLLEELKNIPLDNEKNVKKGSAIIKQYLQNLLEISDEDAAKVTKQQLSRLRQYLERKDFYDQGFSDKDIDLIEKKHAQTQLSQILDQAEK